MCNAWNHPSNCTCGWGGMWHPQRDTPALPHLRVDSFVNPSARCPSCGSAVFFYQSPNGGRVFFDELEPPWPKHPCTDNSAAAPHTAGASKELKVHADAYKWQIEGWAPFLVDAIMSYSPALMQISGQFKGDELLVYLLKRELHATTDPRAFLQLSVIQCKQLREGAFALSILGPSLKPITLTALASSTEAMNPLSPPPRARGSNQAAFNRGRRRRA